MQLQVDFNAKNDYDMINNYKVLQDVFNKLGVEKVCAGRIKNLPLCVEHHSYKHSNQETTNTSSNSRIGRVLRVPCLHSSVLEQ